MGKALLFLVLGASIVLAKQLYGSHENGLRTATDQRNYQETVLAREIAASAFNVGMSEIRAYGDNVRSGVTAFNGTSGAGRSGNITSGKYAGGRYEVRAQQTSGHSVRVIATGYYGRYRGADGVERWRGKVTLHDEYRVFVLMARQTSIINVDFIPGAAGYCSAVFYQAYLPSTPAGSRPRAIMLFTPANGNRAGQHPSREIVVQAGTQMNFFIGVDQNCSERLNPQTTTECQARAHALNYTLDYNHYRADGTNAGNGRFDYLHFALDVEAGELDQAQESIWTMVEQHPTDRNRWRLGWEDIHNTAWNRPVVLSNPSTHNPALSLQATKYFGYNGVGWPTSDSRGYAAMRDFGTRPDFEDQMVEITAIPLDSQSGRTRLDAAIQSYRNCGLIPPADLIAASAAPSSTTPTTTTPTTTTPTTTTPTTTTPTPNTNGIGCSCQGRKKVYVQHYPQGNQSNPQQICIAEDGWLNGHDRHNGDYVLCRGLN